MSFENPPRFHHLYLMEILSHLMEYLVLIGMFIHKSWCVTMPRNKFSSPVNCNPPIFFSLNCNKNEGNSETRILLSSSTNSLIIQLWVLTLWWGKAQGHLPRIRCNCPLKEQLWELLHSVLIKCYWRNPLWNANFKNPHLNVNSET